MRYPSVWCTAVILTGCGGEQTAPVPPAPPPPPPIGAPSTLTIASGDQQTVEPGRPVPIKPAVVVKDAQGRLVPGASVLFVVDSGGGSVAGGPAITGADGIATAGDWTLGPSEGVNVVVATSGTATGAAFHSQGAYPTTILLDDQAIPTGGGNLTVAKPGDPLDGLTISVPAGSYATTTTWRVSAKTGVPVSIKAGAVQVGPTLLVANGQGEADSVMAIRIPARVGSDTALGAFYYEPESRTLEAIPVVSRDGVSLTIAARHFSGDRILVPDAGGAVRARLVSAPRFGQVYIVVVGVPAATLATPLTTTFQPGVDDWEFPNEGSLIAFGGICGGMTTSALYYHYTLKSSRGGLFNRYGPIRLATYWQDNNQGVRLASVIQHNLRSSGALLRQMARMGEAAGVPEDLVHYQSLFTAMYLTGRPQLIGVFGEDGGHSIVAYGINRGVIHVADPNLPGDVTRTIEFRANRFVPLQLQSKATAPIHFYDRINFMAVSAIVPIRAIAAEWTALDANQAGNSAFPAIVVERHNPLTGEWLPLLDTLTSTAKRVQIRTRCPLCTGQRVAGLPADRQYTILIDPTSGDVLGRDLVDNQTGAFMQLPVGTHQVGVWSQALFDPVNYLSFSYVDHQFVSVKSLPVQIVPALMTTKPAVDTTFVVRHYGVAGPGGTFLWNFGDQTPVVKGADSVVRHAFRTFGNYRVAVDVFNAKGTRVATDTADVFVRGSSLLSAWRLDAATPTTVTGTVPDRAILSQLQQEFFDLTYVIDKDRLDHLGKNKFLFYFARDTTVGPNFKWYHGLYPEWSGPALDSEVEIPFSGFGPFGIAAANTQVNPDDSRYQEQGNWPDHGLISSQFAERFSFVNNGKFVSLARGADVRIVGSDILGNLFYKYQLIVGTTTYRWQVESLVRGHRVK